MKPVLLTVGICLMSLLAATPAHPQGKELKSKGMVSGTVTDETKQPAAFATVSLMAATDSSLVQGKITDDKGHFAIDGIAAGNYLVRITYVGYEPSFNGPFAITPESPSVALGDIALRNAPQTLEAVTVSAQRALIERQPDRLVMNLGNSILTKGATADQVLKMAPLVSSGQDGNITLRGKPNVMILLDGKTVPGATLSTVLQNLSAEEIEKLEIITNPSARYEAAASGGVINIITKKGLQDGLNGTYRLNASQGMYARLFTGTSLNYRKGKLNAYGDLNYAGGQNFSNQVYWRNFPAMSSTIENNTNTLTGYHTPSARVGLDYRFNPRHSAGFSVDGYFSDRNTDLRTRSLFSSGQPPPDSSMRATNDGLSRYNLYNFSVNYKGRLDEKGSELSFIGTHSLYGQDTRQTLRYQTERGDGQPLSGGQTLGMNFPSDVNITIAQTDYSLPVGEKLKLEAGLKYTGIRITSRFDQAFSSPGEGEPEQLQVNSGYNEHVAAAYLHGQLSLGQLTLQAGIRGESSNTAVVDTLQRNFFNLFPSVSVQRKLSDNHSVSLSYSRRIDRPLFENLLPIQRYVDPYIIWEGNPYLRPQYSDVLEATGNLRNVTLVAGYTYTRDAMVELPFQDEETLITTNSIRNFARMNTYNLSVVVPVNVTGWWQTNNTLTGLYTDISTSGLNDYAFRTDLVAFTFNTTNTFSLGRQWRGQLTGYYNSSAQYGVLRFEPRSVLSLGVGRDILDKRGSVKVDFDDVFWGDRYNGDATIGPLRQRFWNYSDSRRVRLAFTYKFGKQTVKSASRKKMGNESEQNRLKL